MSSPFFPAANQLLQSGIQQYRQGEVQEALETFQRAIALF